MLYKLILNINPHRVHRVHHVHHVHRFHRGYCVHRGHRGHRVNHVQHCSSCVEDVNESLTCHQFQLSLPFKAIPSSCKWKLITMRVTIAVFPMDRFQLH